MSSTVDQVGGTAITAIHQDIIRTHILTRLDGRTLASTSCVSPHLRYLTDEEKLWTDVCNSTWPSTAHPLVLQAVSTFSSGHRSFFSDSFPSLHHIKTSISDHRCPSETSEFISSVDIRYENEILFSKAVVTKTTSGWFLCSPFRIDLLDLKETVPTPLKFEAHGKILSQLEKNMSLSWILIDSNRKRAVNLSSLVPVMVERHWMTGDIIVKYATFMAGECHDGSPELVQCRVEISCGGKAGGQLNIKEVSTQLEDMDERILNGKGSLVILQDAMDSRRKKRRSKEEETKRYGQYLLMKRERRERKQRRERRQDMLCVAIGVTIFLAFWAVVLLR